MSRVIQLTAGRNHGVAAKEDGTVWAWGENAKGEPGGGLIPVQVRGFGE